MFDTITMVEVQCVGLHKYTTDKEFNYVACMENVSETFDYSHLVRDLSKKICNLDKLDEFRIFAYLEHILNDNNFIGALRLLISLKRHYNEDLRIKIIEFKLALAIGDLKLADNLYKKVFFKDSVLKNFIDNICLNSFKQVRERVEFLTENEKIKFSESLKHKSQEENEKGISAFKKNLFNEAIEHFNLSLQLFPLNIPARLNLFELFLSQKKFNLALLEIKKIQQFSVCTLKEEVLLKKIDNAYADLLSIEL
jgi:hypothetical protein